MKWNDLPVMAPRRAQGTRVVRVPGFLSPAAARRLRRRLRAGARPSTAESDDGPISHRRAPQILKKFSIPLLNLFFNSREQAV